VNPKATHFRNFRYYDLKENWRKVKRHLSDPTLNDILVEDFNKYTVGRFDKPFCHGQCPDEFEQYIDWPSDIPTWREERRGRGQCPHYWSYAVPAGEHWIANFALETAMLVEPRRRWRIITGEFNSTVWDGRVTLFDFTHQALGRDPARCFNSAYAELMPGEFLEVDYWPNPPRINATQLSRFRRPQN
jgi:hypothetical protein